MMATAARPAPTGRTPAEFDDWLAGAQAGERLLIAEGAETPRHLPIWKHAGEAAQEGIIHLHHVRASQPGWWHFIAARAAPREPGADAPVARAVAVEEDDPTETIMRVLRRAANFSRPCPANAELAKLAGLKDAAAASYRMRLLRDLGRIRIHDLGPGRPRVITIVSSGKSTARVSK